ncbi:hypothetical protein GW17_00009033 [Ensete ventricosum]|nr:hypothetical protein GW17_00009033 [Ensete ventricosum]
MQGSGYVRSENTVWCNNYATPLCAVATTTTTCGSYSGCSIIAVAVSRDVMGSDYVYNISIMWCGRPCNDYGSVAACGDYNRYCLRWLCSATTYGGCTNYSSTTVCNDCCLRLIQATTYVIGHRKLMTTQGKHVCSCRWQLWGLSSNTCA